MDVAPQLEERLKKLNQQIDVDRVSGRVKAFEDHIAKGDKVGAEELLKELKAVGVKRSTLDRLEGMIDRKGSASKTPPPKNTARGCASTLVGWLKSARACMRPNNRASTEACPCGALRRCCGSDQKLAIECRMCLNKLQ